MYTAEGRRPWLCVPMAGRTSCYRRNLENSLNSCTPALLRPVQYPLVERDSNISPSGRPYECPKRDLARLGGPLPSPTTMSLCCPGRRPAVGKKPHLAAAPWAIISSYTLFSSPGSSSPAFPFVFSSASLPCCSWEDSSARISKRCASTVGSAWLS